MRLRINETQVVPSQSPAIAHCPTSESGYKEPTTRTQKWEQMPQIRKSWQMRYQRLVTICGICTHIKVLDCGLVSCDWTIKLRTSILRVVSTENKIFMPIHSNCLRRKRSLDNGLRKWQKCLFIGTVVYQFDPAFHGAIEKSKCVLDYHSWVERKFSLWNIRNCVRLIS